jgi:tetratricopeptide (TPR) repeat protein
MWLGNLFQLTDRYDEAIDQYRAACQIQQEITDGVEGEWQFFRSTHGIVQSLYYMDKNQEAFDETIKTLSKYGENEIFKASFLSRFLITGASAAYDLENWDEVISMLDLYPEETLLNLNSGDAMRYDGLKSFALLRLGEHQKAFAIANSVIENVNDEELLSTVGMSYEVRAEILESSDPIASRKDYAAAQAIYVDNGHFTKAKKTALKLLPKASERSRISDPATWL